MTQNNNTLNTTVYEDMSPDMNTDFRALCAELTYCWSRTTNPDDFAENAAPIIGRMKAALAQPEPKEPTVMEIIALADEIEAENLGQVDLVRRALVRWGRLEPEGPTDEDLIQRLLLLAEQAVNEALDYEYEDPEDRYIWRELQELKQLAQEGRDD